MGIDTNLAIGFGSLVIGVISLIAAIVIYFASRRERRPRFHVAPPYLIVDGRAEDDDLQVNYGGKPIVGRSLYVAEVYFWNNGRQPISQADVLKRLEFVVPGATTEILRAELVKTSRSFLKPTFEVASDGPHRVFMDFDVLDYGDGYVFQVLASMDPKGARWRGEATIEGAIVGVREVQRAKNARAAAQDVEQAKKPALIAATLVLVAFAGRQYLVRHLNQDPTWVGIVEGTLAVLGGISAFGASVMGMTFVQALLSRRIPKALDQDRAGRF